MVDTVCTVKYSIEMAVGSRENGGADEEEGWMGKCRQSREGQTWNEGASVLPG